MKEKDEVAQTISLPDDENDGRLPCEGVLGLACNLCQTGYGYQLDDDNWYLIGLQHGYKKEFQMLLDQIKEKLGEGQLFLAFSNDDRHICLVSDQLQSDVHLDNALLYFTNVGLEEYLPRKHFFKLPQMIKGKSFQLIARYSKAFIRRKLIR